MPQFVSKKIAARHPLKQNGGCLVAVVSAASRDDGLIMIPALFFDLDGTLVDSEPLHWTRSDTINDRFA
jgi:hypothetical protein